MIPPSSRRAFLKGAVSASVVPASSVAVCHAGNERSAPLVTRTRFIDKPGPLIKAVTRRDETILRLGGNGDNFHMTWAEDGNQLAAVCDGAGWQDPPKVHYNSRLFVLSGGPHEANFEDILGYPKLTNAYGSPMLNRYYGFGTLAVGRHLYQYLSTPNHVFEKPGARFIGAKLIYSPNGGRTWHNQNGSTPVVWEERAKRSNENMIFFEEDQDAFSLISLLQMGRGYAGNRDGYVYGYSPNGSIDGKMNQLVLFRVSRTKVLQRAAYQFFAGVKAGEAEWAEISARVPIITFPSGWVNSTPHPWAWMPSVTHNPVLGVYMMLSWGNGASPTGGWFGKPSYLGMWISETPWGPWNQVHEETAWVPAGDRNARAFAPQIAPKWIARDGKSLWMVWSDFQEKNTETYAKSFRRIVNKIDDAAMTEQDVAEIVTLARTHQPYYAFNAQRVDLIFS